MKIFQLILNDSASPDFRYAIELYNGINIYFQEYTITQYILNENQILSKSVIDLMNTYDYVFIHNLDNDKNHYIQLYKYVFTKKVLFITNQQSKKFLSKINLEYIHPLLFSCYKIVINKDITDLVNTINKLSDKADITDRLIQFDYIYNPNYSVIENIKNKEIIQISNKGLNSKYELFIDMFLNKKDYLNNFIWKIYGVEKNIQTLSIDKLFIDKETNTPSLITNTDINIIDKDKINLYGVLSNNQLTDILDNAYFACCFDNFNFINYTILDIIYNGTIPIFNIKYAKNIKINNKQSIYDIINGIYIDDKILIDDKIFIQMNKYISSINTYKSTVIRNINICNKLYDPKTNITKLFNQL